eukprot:2057024-Prymnesium_polylepis.1
MHCCLTAQCASARMPTTTSSTVPAALRMAGGATVFELTPELDGRCTPPLTPLHVCTCTDASSPLHSDRLASRRW